MHMLSQLLYVATMTVGLTAGCSLTHRLPSAEIGSGSALTTSRPSLSVPGLDHWSTGFDAVNGVLLRNLHAPSSFHRTRHARAAPSIRGVHLWDSAFMSHIWNAWDTRVSQDVILAVLDRPQDGRLPHFSHRVLKSSLTQPPVIAWAVWENFLWSRDTTFLETAYPTLKLYNSWLHEHRQLPSGLFFWHSPLESGMDNSPRFGDPRRIDHRDTRDLGAIDLSSYIVLENSVLARIADVLGLEAERDFYSRRSAELRTRINALLWDEASGFYYDRRESSGQLVRVRTAASLVALFAGVPDTARAQRLRDHIMDPAAFNSLIPLPSVALDEPSFTKDMWRGPVWINVSYMIIRGLDAYGFGQEAADLAFRTIDGVFRTHHATAGIWEFYDPERFDLRELNRKRGHLSKQLTLGNKPLAQYGWTGLVNMLAIEFIAGYRRDGEQPSVTPRVTPQAAGLRLELLLPGEQTQVRISFADGSAHAEVATGAGREVLLLSAAEWLPLTGTRGAD
jgi:hypothetical protein